MPKIVNITKGEFEKLCKMQVEEEDIADFFGVSMSYLYKWVNEQYGRSLGEVQKSFNSKGRIKLLEIQYKLAEHSVPMAIWLGRNILGQSDRVDVEQTMRVNFVSNVPEVDMNTINRENDGIDEKE